MGLTDNAKIQMAMKQVGLQAKTTTLLDWLMESIEDEIKGETRRRVLELGALVTLNGNLSDSQTDVDITMPDYRKIEVDQIILCDSEQMKITAKDGSPELTVSRGYGGTTPATHTTGAKMKIVGIEEYHNGNGEAGFFHTREYPVVSVTALYDDTDREYAAATLVSAENYAWYKNGKVELDTGYFNRGLKNIKVVYNAGYSPVPMDLQRLATEWVILAFKGLTHLGISSVSSPDGGATLFYEFLTPELKKILRRYRRPFSGN